MPTEKKIQEVEELSDILSRGTVIIAAEYRGLKVSESTALRRQLRDSGIEMHVIKNTLFRLAAEKAGRPVLNDLAQGPTALIIGFGDPIAPVKTVVEYQRTARNTFAARQAYVDGEIIPAARLIEFAALPSRDQLIAQVAGALQSPLATLVGLLGATLQEFSALLDARTEQMEGAA